MLGFIRRRKADGLDSESNSVRPRNFDFDEPESNLDFKNQITVLDVLSKLRDSGFVVYSILIFPITR